MNASRNMMSGDKLNLERIHMMLVDDNQQALDIMGQVVTAFGVRQLTKCTSMRDAKLALRKTPVDFILTDAQMPDEDGYDFVHWIRNDLPEPNRYVPIVLVTGHTRASEVMRARDCGAHFLVAKPVTPKVLLERIYWVARDERKFMECDAYNGPDRRFQRQGPPAGSEGRREDDLSGDLGSASEPNLSQDEINSLMKPAKVSL